MGTVLTGTPKFSMHPSAVMSGFTDTDGGMPQYCGNPLQVQIIIPGDSMTYVPVSGGDIVNVKFQIYGQSIYGSIPDQYKPNLLLAEVIKSVDVRYMNYENQFYSVPPNGVQQSGDINAKTFTVDIAPFIRPHLSYCLVPCGKGSHGNRVKDGQGYGAFTGNYSDQEYTAMNQMMMLINIRCYFQVLDIYGELTWATTSAGSSTLKNIKSNTSGNVLGGGTGYQFPVINAVRQWNQKQNLFNLQGTLVAGTSNVWFLSDCPNNSATGGTSPNKQDSPRKEMVITEDTETLYFFLNKILRSDRYSTYFNSGFNSQVWNVFFLVEHKKGGTVYQRQLDTEDDAFQYTVGFNNPDYTGTSDLPDLYSSRQWFRSIVSQNVSPEYINNNSGTVPAGESWSDIDNTSEWWRVSVQWQNSENSNGTSGGVCAGGTSAGSDYGIECVDDGGVWTPNQYRRSEYRYYKPLVRAESPAFPYTRIHWLNDLGGIDTYTFTRNKTSSLERSISTYERKPVNPLYQIDQQSLGTLTFGENTNLNLYKYSVTNRSEGYQTEQEILDVQMRKSHTVFSDPLDNVTMRWLEGMFRSPNVWVQTYGGENPAGHGKSRGEFAQDVNPFWHVSENDYLPILITNSDVVTLDEEQGMVQIQLEYQEGVSQKTQSN